MKTHHLFLPAALVFAGCQETSTSAQGIEGPQFRATTVTSSFLAPTEFTRFLPCAQGGAGEDVTMSGNLHFVVHATVDAAGGNHLTVEINNANVRGVGQVSGARYQATGAYALNLNELSPGTVTCTSVLNFGIVGQEASNHLLATIHFTVNANGDMTATVDNVSLVCDVQGLPTDLQFCGDIPV